MRRKLLVVGAIGGCAGVVLGILFMVVDHLNTRAFQTFLLSATPESIAEISLSTRGDGTARTEIVFASESDIAKVIEALRASTENRPNHPDYERSFSLDIVPRHAPSFRLTVDVGGDVGETAVYYFHGGSRRSKALFDLIMASTDAARGVSHE